MDDAERKYLLDNTAVARELLTRLERRRLLRDRSLDEDYELCRRSADELRGVLEELMVKVQDDGFLMDALREMQAVCTNFVSAAGIDSEVFWREHVLFWDHLAQLRDVFARNVGLVVTEFNLRPTSNIGQVIAYRR